MLHIDQAVILACQDDGNRSQWGSLLPRGQFIADDQRGDECQSMELREADFHPLQPSTTTMAMEPFGIFSLQTEVCLYHIIIKNI